jgi:predicted Zn-dependent protease
MLRTAAAMEDGLRYDEPATWYSPVCQRLGRILLADGQAAEAEKAFREDLLRNPENGWSLDGLAKSLKAQGKTAESAEATRRFRKVWTRADVTP